MLKWIFLLVGVASLLLSLKFSRAKQATGRGNSVLTTITAVIAIICASFFTYMNSFVKDTSEEDSNNQFLYYRGLVLGEYMRKAAPDSRKIGIIIEPVFRLSPWGDELPPDKQPVHFELNGLLAGLGIPESEALIVHPFPDQKRADRDKAQMLQMMDDKTVEPTCLDSYDYFGAPQYNECLKKLDGCDMVITLCKFYRHTDADVLRRLPAKAHVALTDVGNRNGIASLFKGQSFKCRLDAVVTYINGCDFGILCPKEPQKAFDIRYQLVTPDNYMNADTSTPIL